MIAAKVAINAVQLALVLVLKNLVMQCRILRATQVVAMATTIRP